jgi:hypothetical protein
LQVSFVHMRELPLTMILHVPGAPVGLVAGSELLGQRAPVEDRVAQLGEAAKALPRLLGQQLQQEPAQIVVSGRHANPPRSTSWEQARRSG